MALTDADKSPHRNGAREPILAAAADLFHANGYSATSMQDIARAAGLSRPALYYHFKDKHDILSALVDQITLRTQREADRIANTAPGRGATEVLREVVCAHALVILERPSQFSVLLREERHLPEPARTTQRRGKRDLMERVAGIIEQGVAAGEFRSVDAQIASLSIFGMCNWTVEWFRPAGRFKAAEVARTIGDLALAMVARPVVGGRDTASLKGCLALLRDDVARLEWLLEASEKP